MIKIFIPTFHSPHYPEDSRILGTFSTLERAQEAIKDSIELDKWSYPKHPRRYQQNILYYYIDYHYLDGEEDA